MKKLGKLVSVFMILSCLIGITNVSAEYIHKFDNKEIETAVLNNVKKSEELEKEEQRKQEEAKRQEEQQIQVQRTQQPVYQQQVTGNNITIPGVLSKPLMKDYDGSNFYINHDIYGNYNANGTPYIDFRTNFQTRKTIIYAHSSMSGNGPFQGLQNYHNNPGYYSGHRYITINYEGATYTYEIFSVYVSTANSDEDYGLEYFYTMNYSDDAWSSKIQEYKNNSEYDTGVPVSGNDRILILQTCSMDSAYYERYYRYNLLIMAKLV